MFNLTRVFKVCGDSGKFVKTQVILNANFYEDPMRLQINSIQGKMYSNITLEEAMQTANCIYM